MAGRAAGLRLPTDEEWKSNPDLKLGMVSYLGLPINWPDGEIRAAIDWFKTHSDDFSTPTYGRRPCPSPTSSSTVP
jgi:hypothetical protein